jgi:hypothetical protein
VAKKASEVDGVADGNGVLSGCMTDELIDGDSADVYEVDVHVLEQGDSDILIIVERPLVDDSIFDRSMLSTKTDSCVVERPYYMRSRHHKGDNDLGIVCEGAGNEPGPSELCVVRLVATEDEDDGLDITVSECHRTILRRRSPVAIAKGGPQSP